MKYITPSLARNIAKSAGVAPLSKFGQNFMVDPGQVQKIVQLANIVTGETVLEIGPGLGSLTLGLLEANANVIAVEIDSKLAELLPQTIRQLAPEHVEQLHIINTDVLELNTATLENINNLKVVSNLPYNIATPILLTLLSRFPAITQVLVLIQAEVANRLVAQPSSKIYGIPSVKLAWYGTTHESATIPRSSFWPVPHVDSKLIQFNRYEDSQPWQQQANRDDIFALVNLAFSARRKTLKSLLVHDGYASETVTQTLDSLQIDPLARGETLHIKQYAELTKLLQKSTPCE